MQQKSPKHLRSTDMYLSDRVEVIESTKIRKESESLSPYIQVKLFIPKYLTKFPKIPGFIWMNSANIFAYFYVKCLEYTLTYIRF